MLSVKDIKQKTGLSRQRIDLLISKGQLKATLFGGNMYAIDEKDFEKFIKNRENNPDTRLKKIHKN
jgi:hypothetical protein